ncbi:DNA polymerase IV 1 [Aquisalinus flavus]|uniref:DNA polymerase IV n=2 Tax=Aquisalinus flavus TaxID=1526572 RepID=A0A8J2Y4Z3_9PROT|nr:DNA polymerase IV 1 [Aquisalinus flavus]
MRLLRHAELYSLSIAHLDCDAFFAAVEKRDNPELADKPVIVGGGKRGVVSTACYIARIYGVHSAMPMFKALKACPQAVVIKGNYEKYTEASRQIRAHMEALTPLVQAISIDEAFMDLSGTEKLHHAPPAVTLARLARRIEEKVGISVSIGLSHNKFLAKSASDLDKPRGFAIIGREETLSFLAGKPISFIWGVGASFSAKLSRDGFNTIGDLQRADPRDLVKRYGEHGLRLARLSLGEDSRPVNPERETKSVSAETTFNEDLRDYAALEDILWRLCEKVSRRMKEKGFAGRVVTLKLKTAQFRTLTRRSTLEHHTNLARELFNAGKSLLREEIPGGQSRDSYRLIGIGFSDLVAAEQARQSFFFMEDHIRLEAQESAIDRLRARFGDDIIGSARGLGTRKNKESK